MFEVVTLKVSQDAIPAKQDLGKKWFAFSKFDKEAFTLLDKLAEVVSE